jgi:hypothetical protein
MDADIRITDVGEASELRRYARRRLGPIVRNPRSGIEGVCLSVNKVPGRAPKEVRCQILVRVSPRLSLSVERLEVSAHEAIDAATDRLGWALGVWHGADLMTLPPLEARPRLEGRMRPHEK